MSDDPLRLPVSSLRGVTPARREQLDRLGLRTLNDLLFHLPHRYEDLSDVRAIADLQEGTLQTVRGEVVEIDGRRLADGRPVISVVISDDNKRALEGVWFNQTSVASRYRYGQRVAFSGKPKWFRDHWQMTSPRVQTLDSGGATEAASVVPIYPLTEDLPADRLRALVRQAVDLAADRVAEVLPPTLRSQRDLPTAAEALRHVHFPETAAAAARGKRRFVYEEFLLLQLGLALRRREVRDRLQAPRLPVTPEIDARIRRLFPYRLTADQDKAIADVCRDLANERPMQRLLQADVGAGKTAVALYALLVAVANKHQGALMAPTEVLARQHWNTLDEALAHSRVRRLLLTGSLSPKERAAALVAIEKGDVDLVVGTQALAQEGVAFAKLGLVVIDEQHKFGVNQRAKVRRLGVDPHYLVMTATPIPRTTALTVFGDLDVSLMRQRPPGRLPVTTRWVQEGQRERLYERLRAALSEGRQGYVVCPLVEESEKLDLKSATQVHEELQSGPFAAFRLGLLHGRQPEEEKAEVMKRFRARDLDLLICTPVVEVGVDVANATLMVVEHAERFGLSQLHQLRGRVSRGPVGGQCVLFATPAATEARERLRVFVRTDDGFALAEEDVKLRGVGQLFGTRQHGLGELRFGDPAKDLELLQEARRDAIALVAADARLSQPEHEALRRAVAARYGAALELAEVG